MAVHTDHPTQVITLDLPGGAMIFLAFMCKGFTNVYSFAHCQFTWSYIYLSSYLPIIYHPFSAVGEVHGTAELRLACNCGGGPLWTLASH